MSQNILEINNLSKYFGGLAAVSEWKTLLMFLPMNYFQKDC